MDWELSRIVPDVEDAFGIAIADVDAERLTTVGDLFDHVIARRFRDVRGDYLSSIAFYKVRRALMSNLQLSRDAVQPATKLSAVAARHRRRLWQAIKKQTGLRLPMLRRPSRLVTTATLAAIGLGVSVPLLLGLKPLGGANVVAIVSVGVFGYIFYLLTAAFARELPPDVVTVGDLAKAVFARNYQPILAESKRSMADGQVWDTLRRIVANQLELLPGEITRETGFSRHLVAG
jgi:hypothetical protein